MPVQPMPERGEPGKLRFSVATPEGVAAMVDALAAMEPVKGYSPDRRLSEAADQLNLLAATEPDWLMPHRRRLTLDMPDRFPAGFDALCVLLTDLELDVVDALAQRAAESSDFFDWWLLAAVDSEPARHIAADAARAAGKLDELHDVGVEVRDAGPAVWRFTRDRYAMFVDPNGEGAGHRWEPPTETVANDLQVRWAYCTVDVAAIETMPAWSPGLAHMIAVARDPLWMAQGSIDGEGRIVDVTIVAEDEDEDADYEAAVASHRAKVEGTEQAVAARLVALDDQLVYCNGHVELTPDLLAVVGGPPLGLYGSPDCRSCGRLMFHIATLADRRYDEGFRSLYICEDCTLVATRAKNWN